MRQENSVSWIVLFLRLTLGILFFFSGIAFLLELQFFTSPVGEVKPWFPTNYSLLVSKSISLALVLLGMLLAVGYKTSGVSIITAILLMLIHVLWLKNNRLYNSLHHTAPYVLITLIILHLARRENMYSIDFLLKREVDDRIEHTSFITCALRLFVGFIFLFQGYGSMLKTPIEFARRVYVEQFRNTILPESLLWLTGFLNPFIQIAGALFLIFGFKTYQTCIILGFFMLSIVFGHMFIDPYETGGDLTAYGLNNFLFLLGALYYNSLGNKYSLDGLL